LKGSLWEGDGGGGEAGKMFRDARKLTPANSIREGRRGRERKEKQRGGGERRNSRYETTLQARNFRRGINDKIRDSRGNECKKSELSKAQGECQQHKTWGGNREGLGGLAKKSEGKRPQRTEEGRLKDTNYIDLHREWATIEEETHRSSHNRAITERRLVDLNKEPNPAEKEKKCY